MSVTLGPSLPVPSVWVKLTIFSSPEVSVAALGRLKLEKPLALGRRPDRCLPLALQVRQLDFM